jgi:hypothetical protein
MNLFDITITMIQPIHLNQHSPYLYVTHSIEMGAEEEYFLVSDYESEVVSLFIAKLDPDTRALEMVDDEVISREVLRHLEKDETDMLSHEEILQFAKGVESNGPLQ